MSAYISLKQFVGDLYKITLITISLKETDVSLQCKNFNQKLTFI